MSETSHFEVPFERVRVGTMEALLAPYPGSGLVAASAMIRRGSVDETEDEHGLADYTMSMLMRGTRRRNHEQLANDLESLGAFSGENAGIDACSLGMRSAAAEAPAALEILFEALREPAFDPDEHEIHRRQLLAHLRMAEDEKFSYTYREYLKVMFAGHGYAHPSEGEIEDAQRIAPEHCRAWHAEFVRPENMMFIAAGDFEIETMRDLLARLTEGWEGAGEARSRQSSPPPPEHEPLLELQKSDLQQGFIVIGYRTPTITHEDYPALRLASAALGEGFSGRIFANLRDKKSLAYALGSTLRPYRLAAQQVMYIGTKPESIDEAHAGLLEEADAIRQTPLEPHDLERARQYVLGRFLMGQQSLAQRAGHLAWWEDTGGGAAAGREWPDRLRAVTAADVQAAAQRWWTDPTTAILRPTANQ